MLDAIADMAFELPVKGDPTPKNYDEEECMKIAASRKWDSGPHWMDYLQYLPKLTGTRAKAAAKPKGKGKVNGAPTKPLGGVATAAATAVFTANTAEAANVDAENSWAPFMSAVKAGVGAVVKGLRPVAKAATMVAALTSPKGKFFEIE